MTALRTGEACRISSTALTMEHGEAIQFSDNIIKKTQTRYRVDVPVNLLRNGLQAMVSAITDTGES